MAVDIGRELKSAIATGKVYLGFEETKKALKNGSIKLVITANNIPDEMESAISKYKRIARYSFSGSNHDLGSLCGKPFPVAVLGIEDPGDSNIMKLTEE